MMNNESLTSMTHDPDRLLVESMELVLTWFPIKAHNTQTRTIDVISLTLWILDIDLEMKHNARWHSDCQSNSLTIKI